LHLRDAAIKGGNQFEQFTDDARAYHRHLPPLDRSVRERVALEGINAKPFIGPSRERCFGEGWRPTRPQGSRKRCKQVIIRRRLEDFRGKNTTQSIHV
jgi:hypothetical protein